MTCSCCRGSSSTLSAVVNVASPSSRATLRSRLSGRRLSHCTQKSLADRFITHWSGCHLGLRCAQLPCSILTSKTAQVECEGVPAIRTDRETKLSCNNPRQSGQQCPTTTRVSRAPQREQWHGPKRERGHAYHLKLFYVHSRGFLKEC